MKPELLSNEDCTKILQNRFKKNNPEFISYELKGISGNVEGFLGEHYNLIITYKLDNEINTETFFLKTIPNSSDFQKEICKEYAAYQKEIFIYDTLMKEFEKHGYDTNFAGKCYFCIPNQSLIFENLVHNGFQLSERLQPFDLDKIKSVLKCLALFHAAGFAYQDTKNKELGGSFSIEVEFADFLQESVFTFYTNPEQENSIARTWWKSAFKTIDKIIDLLPESEIYRSEFKEMINSYPFGKVFVTKTKLAKTFGHGDLWSNNMLFKYEEDKVVDARLLDFQLGRNFYPSFDVVLVIFTNTTAEFRKSHSSELYQYYYNILTETLTSYGCSVEDIIPEEDFYESIRLVNAEAMLQALCTLMFLGLPQETLNQSVTENNGEGLLEIITDNVEMSCDAFKNSVKFNKTITDAMSDLRDALVEMI